MATRGVKPGRENITANLPEGLAQSVDELAHESGLTKSKYVRTVLEDACRRRLVFKVTMHQFTKPDEKAA